MSGRPALGAPLSHEYPAVVWLSPLAWPGFRGSGVPGFRGFRGSGVPGVPGFRGFRGSGGSGVPGFRGFRGSGGSGVPGFPSSSSTGAESNLGAARPGWAYWTFIWVFWFRRKACSTLLKRF
jgi:hypothetical protein